jgi:hypothetical protein
MDGKMRLRFLACSTHNLSREREEFFHESFELFIENFLNFSAPKNEEKVEEILGEN